MKVRDEIVRCRMTSAEKKALKRKASKMGMTVSQYIRFTAIESNNLKIVTIDTTLFQKATYELMKQGVNLNQLMKFLNTYGIDAYNAEQTRRMLIKEGEVYQKICHAVGELRSEAEKHHVYITELNMNEEGSGDETGAEAK